ncbi:MAG: hypothetical protein KAW41_07075 [Candidatus Diapherotrites archaeon]|nr:hypothetical protein [Candidatus Diapherotrites archaeon]
MIGIVASEKDIAGMSMLESLKARGFEDTFEEWAGTPVLGKGDLRAATIPQDIIHAESMDGLAELFDLEFLVFASRHRSQAGTPSLTVHSTGNFGKAEFGGREKELQATLANAKHNVYLELRECTLDYEVALEVTHHGPTGFRTPLFFVEIGSSEKQWRDKEAAEFVVDCILAGLESNKKHQHAIGFGGGHYAPRFSEMEEVAFGHICPKYAADLLDDGLVKQMVEKTVDRVDCAVIDEKGLKGRQKLVIKKALDGLGVEY